MYRGSIPFEPAFELNKQLRSVTLGEVVVLERTDATAPYSLPGQPLVLLQPSAVIQHSQQELLTPKLNTMAPRLWLVATQSSASISPLHHQIVRGRAIVRTENPELHLVWISDRVFVKPLPPFLLSHSFWKVVFEEATGPPLLSADRELLYRSAVGYVRTYCHLIKHESDFEIAVQNHLVPLNITFEAFCGFIKDFRQVPDSAVSARYRYGDLRLTRLNLWSKVFLRKFKFEEVAGQYSEYFFPLFQPLLFAFGTFSVLLSAMQVDLGVEQLQGVDSAWQTFSGVSRWFAIITIIIVAFAVAVLIGVVLFMGLSELIYALSHYKRSPPNEEAASQHKV